MNTPVAIPSKKHIPVLDGLRFIAAFSVALAHYSHWVLNDQGIKNQLTDAISTLSGIGMAVFFVLSGFVIHYNYHSVCRKEGGKKAFFIARFTRLYPLFIVMFLIEFVSSFHAGRGACGLAGARWGYFFALPYYLTLTQAWFFGVICNNNLLHQYHMLSAPTWSISVESFFYIAYVFIVYWLVAQKNIVTQIKAAVLANVAVVAYFLFCSHFTAEIEKAVLVAFGPIATLQNGYENSFARWLYYFNPVMNLAAFFSGAVAANIYLLLQDKSVSRREEKWGNRVTLFFILSLLALHFWLCLDVAATNGFIGRTVSSLYVPLVVVIVYCLARYENGACSRFISARPLVKLGEASYSIYLLHAFFAWFPRDWYYLGLNPWILYAISVTCVLIISRYTYVYFERPVQRWLRAKMTA